MSLDLATTVTGAVIGGFTAPTYVLGADNAPNSNSRQAMVTGLGGTQTGVTSHTVTDPFTFTVVRPKNFISPPRANPVTGAVGTAGRNKTSLLFRKGTKPLVGQAAQVSDVKVDINIVAGAETNDAANVAALLSLAAAACQREAANILLAVKTGNI